MKTAWYNCINQLVAYYDDQGRTVLVHANDYDNAYLIGTQPDLVFVENDKYAQARKYAHLRQRTHPPTERTSIYRYDAEGHVASVTRVTLHEEVRLET